MKTTTMRTMMAAAALVVAAGTASAQTSYKAEIPMAFRASGKVMTPGSYSIRVENTGAGDRVYLYNATDRSAVTLGTGVHADAPKAWRDSGDARIAFACVDGSCSLRSMWNGSDPYALNFHAPKAVGGQLVAHRSEVIVLSMVKAH